MKISKKMSEKALAANQENGKKSPGPEDTTQTRYNAVRHSLLARHLKFDNDEDEAEFARLTQELEAEYRPVGTIERALLQEISICLWKLSLASGWEMRELNNQRRAAQAILKSFAETDESEIALLAQNDGTSSAAQLGWRCRELTIRSDNSHSDQEGFTSVSERNSKRAQVFVEARLSTGIDTVLRYESMLKRDLYKAISALQIIQEKRLSSEQESLEGWGE